ncbi:MAG: M15 family metallopeptidase [Clostridiales bacterium]|nr:M15 family metallopeptidase [Clostridiales bacterium]
MRQLLSILMLVLTLGQSGVHSLVDQTNLGGQLYLVNRDYRLTSKYEPDDLVMPQVRKASSAVLMREEAARMLERLFEDAQQEGHRLVAISGYRSYATQNAIYRRKIGNSGKARASLLVAPPGASEHQLGLAMDVSSLRSGQLNSSFGKSQEGQWVARHAHQYGFIIRYKADWTDITGYADEPWHLRYVGVEHAARLAALDVPLETYVAWLAKTMFGEYLSDAII